MSGTMYARPAMLLFTVCKSIALRRLSVYMMLCGRGIRTLFDFDIMIVRLYHFRLIIILSIVSQYPCSYFETLFCRLYCRYLLHCYLLFIILCVHVSQIHYCILIHFFMSAKFVQFFALEPIALMSLLRSTLSGTIALSASPLIVIRLYTLSVVHSILILLFDYSPRDI